MTHIGRALCLALICVLYHFSITSGATVLDSPKNDSVLPGRDVRQDNGPRIINGNVAALNKTMHQVSIRRRLTDLLSFGEGHMCGGSLIAPNLVLSAAHCFVSSDNEEVKFLPANRFRVVMGNLDRFEKNENTLVYDIKEIVFALSVFDLKTFEKDIALLFLNDSVPWNHNTVAPIKLNRDFIPANTICHVTGWGKTEDGYLSDKLLTVDVPIIDFEICAKWTKFGDDVIKPGMLCAGYKLGDRDACSGDSGGPLVCNGKQVGVVSFGIGCAQPWLPGVYTNVAYYLPWITREATARNVTLQASGSNASLRTSFVLLVGLLMTNSLLGNLIN